MTFVRILENGTYKSISKEYAESLGEDVDVTDLPATNRRGAPLAPSPIGADVDYDAMTVDALKAEIDKRNATRDEASHVSAVGLKADLVGALQADDANPETPAS